MFIYFYLRRTVNYAALFNADGELKGYAAVCTDICRSSNRARMLLAIIFRGKTKSEL